MKRVAFVVTGLERGGAELQVVQLAIVLRGRGWDVAVFSLRGGELAGSLHAAGITVGRFPLDVIGFRPHVLHAHLFHANVAVRVARLFLPVPVVISTVHSLAESSRRGGGIRTRDLMYRATDWLADATVFVSTAAAERHLAANAVSPTRTHVIPNGIDTMRFRPQRERAERGPFTWLAAGRLMWKKNYPLLLEAMKQQPAAVLRIAGEGPDGDALRASAPANVEFLGPRADIAELMNTADGFVLSSSVEGLPMVLLEAAASGLPCVATAVGGVPEAVLDGRTGYLTPPGDAAALAAAMTRVAALPEEERAAMGRAARQYAEARFELTSVVDQWERLYNTLLAEEERQAAWT